MISKISLGTVQFGQNYGIANTRGQVSKSEVVEILNYAASVGVDCLDTAFAYGESESVIGGYLREHPNSFKIVSKLPPLESYSCEKAEEFLGQSMQRLGARQLYGYLLHRSNDVLINAELWNGLVRLKENGHVGKIGFSLYSPDELILLLDKEIEFDIVQVPYSIFDRRFEKYFDLLNKKDIEIQARSVFLQGLAFLHPDKLPEDLNKAKDCLAQLQNLSKSQQVTISALCLNFVLLNPLVDKAVIGVDSLQHLMDNLHNLCALEKVKVFKKRLETFIIKDEDIILPSRWRRT